MADRPQVRNTELPAGDAFNNALRAMASRNGFVTQWFGWQHLSSMAAESAQSAERLIWIINWQDISSAKTLCHPGELEDTIGVLVEFFHPPDLALSDHSIAAEIGASRFLVVRWTQGDAVKILNWTNRTVMFDVQQHTSVKAEDSEQYIASEDSEDEWTARGQVVAPSIKSDDWTAAPAVIRSLPRQQGEQELPFEEPTFHHGRSDGSSITVSLTRTRWCTSIRKDLVATIKARRVD